MGIKRSTLYYQPKKNINKKQKELRIRKEIEDISREHPYYGYRRITASLRRDQVIINHNEAIMGSGLEMTYFFKNERALMKNVSFQDLTLFSPVKKLPNY